MRLDLLTRWRCLSLPRLAFLGHYTELIAGNQQTNLTCEAACAPSSNPSQRGIDLVIAVLQSCSLASPQASSCPLNFKPSEMEKEGIPTRAKLKRSER